MSKRTPRWRWWLMRLAPFLFRRCEVGNAHWRTDRLCHCTGETVPLRRLSEATDA